MLRVEKGGSRVHGGLGTICATLCQSEIISEQKALKHAVRRRGEIPLKPLPGTASYLALREEVGHQCPLHSVLHVTIREDDQGRFTSQFQRNGFDSFRGHLHDLTEREETHSEGSHV